MNYLNELYALRLIEKYDKLNSSNSDNVREDRKAILSVLEYILPLTNRRERVVEGCLV